MFRLQFHERTQRRVCRVGFILLCLLPTLGVCAWAVSVRLPSHRQAAVSQLSCLLGLPSTVERVTHPRPGSTTLESVTFTSSSSDRQLGSVERIEIRQHRDAGHILHLHGVHLRAERLRDTATALMHATVGGDNVPLSYVVIDRLSILPPEDTHRCEPFILTELYARSGTERGKKNGVNTSEGIHIKCRLEGKESKQVTSLTIRHQASVMAESTDLIFDTGGEDVSCWWLASLIPNVEMLGPDATFRGTGRITWQADQSRGQLAGELKYIDFRRTTNTLPLGALQATGAVTIEKLQWSNGRIEEAYGTLRCGSGTIDGRLVDAAVRALTCTEPKEATATSTDALVNDIPFDELAFRFALGANGLTLWGACESVGQGIMLARGNRPLLTEPRYKRLPVANLVYLFVPQVRHYVPATREAQAIAGRLPLPSSAVKK